MRGGKRSRNDSADLIVERVFRLISEAAERNADAPTHREMIEEAGADNSRIAYAVGKLVKEKRLEKRIDPEHFSRRCYRIVATGATTARWDKAFDKLPPSRRRVAAEAPEVGSARRKRKCMCCGADFLSEGAGNRLCVSCRGKDGGWLPAARIAL
ncbi:hypothetical protein [Parvibaculum sp.]|uniref:hypothetical protein n=1 Tax=Parvibaculum sp. TaxID=2024848 RepID=UPI00391CF72B